MMGIIWQCIAVVATIGGLVLVFGWAFFWLYLMYGTRGTLDHIYSKEKTKETNDNLQRQIDDLKRELEELKRKE